jgi:diguanylate cyclase (GGDEF)-like protein
MALALLLGYFILRRALFHIRQLTVAVKNIGRGESFESLNIERSDEIGQLAKSFQQIERSLRTDKLTSVLNRDSLIAQIDFHCSVGREVDFLRFTLLFIDLDGFKQINDLYGHDEGDRVLSESARRLQQAIRKEDAVARFGGDEFVVYLHGVSEAGTVAAICEKIRASLETPIHLRQGAIVHVGASIGHASFPEDGPNSDVLLRIADNRMFFDKKMRKSTLQLPLQ